MQSIFKTFVKLSIINQMILIVGLLIILIILIYNPGAGAGLVSIIVALKACSPTRPET
jgi:hypothetical protein